MAKADLTALIRNRNGLIFSEGTHDVVALLARAHDLMLMYNMRTKLIGTIALYLGLEYAQSLQPIYPLYYSGQIRTTRATQEEMSELLNEDVFNFFNNLAPRGFYFGSHEGDGSCFGWFREDI